MVELIDRYLDAFAEHDADVGRTDLVFHEIDVQGSRPLRQPARRLPYGQNREEVEKQIKELEKARVIRPFASPWASPIVLVKKKDGAIRMCVDYRRLTSVTRLDSFPIPRLDEALEAFSGSEIFSRIDLAMAYHQVPVEPKDIGKTAFITHAGLYEFVTMPFGLCNAPGTYQRLMNTVLQGLIGHICLAYLDDVIVFSKNPQNHLKDLEQVFKRISDSRLKMKPRKCKFFRDEVLYLGH